MDMKRIEGLWYFAHPHTAKDANGNYVPEAEEANFRLCNYRAAVLLQLGYNIYSPISHSHPIHRASPTFLARHEHEMWYELDNEMIVKCDFKGVILAPGWQHSKGCDGEKKAFEKLDRIVKFYDDIVNANIKKDMVLGLLSQIEAIS